MTLADQRDLLPLITPLEVVHSIGGVRVYAKKENEQVTGSIKYRVGWHLIDAAERCGDLRAGSKIIEETGPGNTGIALSYLGRETGYPVSIVISKGLCPREAQRMMLDYGAEVIPVDGWSPQRQALIKEMMRSDPSYFWTHQGSNPAAMQASMQLGTEILGQLPDVNYFLACTGTCATIAGVGTALKERNPRTHVIGVVPSHDFEFPAGHDYRTYPTPHLKGHEAMLDEPFVIEDEDAVRQSVRLLHKRGDYVGFTSGASFYAATQKAEQLRKQLGSGTQANILIIFPDSGSRYVSLLGE